MSPRFFAILNNLRRGLVHALVGRLCRSTNRDSIENTLPVVNRGRMRIGGAQALEDLPGFFGFKVRLPRCPPPVLPQRCAERGAAGAHR